MKKSLLYPLLSLQIISCTNPTEYSNLSASSLINNSLDSRLQVGEICRDFLDDELSEAQAVHQLDIQRQKLAKIKPYLDTEIELLRKSSQFHKICFKSKVYSYMYAHMIPLARGHKAQEKLYSKKSSHSAVHEALSKYDDILPDNYIYLVDSNISLKDIQLQRKFQEAIVDADLHTVRQMMQAEENQFATADAQTIEKYLRLAIQSDSPSMFRFFLKKRPDVNKTMGSYEHTLLMIAAKEGKSQITNYLLNHGASKTINQFNKLGTTALIEAACNGHPKIMSQLLRHGANINAANEFDETALEKAVSYGKISSISLLLKHSKAISHFDKRLQKCINIAKQLNYMDVVSLLLKYQ